MKIKTLFEWENNNEPFESKLVRVDDIIEFIHRNQNSYMASDMIIKCLLLQFVDRKELK